MTPSPDTLHLVVFTHFFPAHSGGIELVAGKLVGELAKRGVQVQWISSDTDPPPVATTSMSVVYVPIGTSNLMERRTQLPYPVWTPFAMPKLWRAIGEADIIHIHEHLYLSSISALLIARVRRRPTVITQHMGHLGFRSATGTWLYERGTRFLGFLLFPLATRRVFISANVRKFFGRDSDPRSALIFNGVDTRCFCSRAEIDRQRQRASLGISNEQKVVLFVGRFVRKKGLSIIRRLADRFPSVLWLFVGSGPEDPSRWGCVNVSVPGRLTHELLADYYHVADVLLLPSSGEGFPLVVQEALCCGTGVLSSDEVSSACPEASGMLRSCPTPRGEVDVEVWARALASVLADKAYLNSRHARSQKAISLWSWEQCTDHYLDLFSGIVREQR